MNVTRASFLKRLAAGLAALPFVPDWLAGSTPDPVSTYDGPPWLDDGVRAEHLAAYHLDRYDSEAYFTFHHQDLAQDWTFTCWVRVEADAEPDWFLFVHQPEDGVKLWRRTATRHWILTRRDDRGDDGVWEEFIAGAPYEPGVLYFLAVQCRPGELPVLMLRPASNGAALEAPAREWATYPDWTWATGDADGFREGSDPGPLISGKGGPG